MSYLGNLTNQGGTEEVSAVFAVNTSNSLAIEKSTCTLYVKSVVFSNTADFAILVTPTAGKVTCQHSMDGITYYAMRGGNFRANLPSGFIPIASGDINFAKITTTGITGAAFVKVTYSCSFAYDPSFDIRLYQGLQAITVQPFTEVNSKTGTQWEFSNKNLAVPNGANLDFVMTTGTYPILIKDRQLTFNGVSIVSRVYMNPTFSGGTPVTAFNMNTINPKTAGFVIKAAPTVTSVGTEIAAPTYGIGSNAPGNATSATYSARGGERVLAPNTSFLLRITNDSGAAMDISAYLTWYEGDLSVDL